MLVLSRYKDQSIYIGDDIVVTIVDVRGDRIRLGIEAGAPPGHLRSDSARERRTVYGARRIPHAQTRSYETVFRGLRVQTSIKPDSDASADGTV